VAYEAVVPANLQGLATYIKKVIKADLEIINNNVKDASLPKPAKRNLTT
jgi:hypothetical protein